MADNELNEYTELSRVIFSEDIIQKRVKELAQQIDNDYAYLKKSGKQLVIVGILKGAFLFMSDLVKRLKVPHRVDFMALSSYGKGTKSTGAVRIVMDLRSDIDNEDVLIVEDIIDSGYTLKFLNNLLLTRSPRTIKTCVFLRKLECLKVDFKVDYCGFDAPNVWVVGYGLDYAERLRTLPFVGELKREVYEEKK